MSLPKQSTNIMKRLDWFLIKADRIIKHAKRLCDDLKLFLISLIGLFILFRHCFHII